MYRLTLTGLPLMAKAAVVAAVGLVALILHAPMRAETQTRQSLSLHVEETTGIRRTRYYPFDARVPFPQGALARAAQVRLLRDDEEIPAQFAAGSRWPDGSVQWLSVDVNASIGPEETQPYRVEYGPGVSAGDGPGRGLTLIDDTDAGAVQVGRVRFSKTAAPLLTSVSYRGEVVGSGRNGFAVEDTDGMVYALGGAGQASFHVAPAAPVTRHVLTVYQHFVGTPVQIGAATSPPSMLYPLVARVDPAQYLVSGLEPPADR